MSWSATFDCSIGSIRAAGKATTPSLTTGYAEDEQVAAYATAIEAAVVAGDAIGVAGDMVRVTLSGHANAGLQAVGNWAKDCISVRVDRL